MEKLLIFTSELCKLFKLEYSNNEDSLTRWCDFLNRYISVCPRKVTLLKSIELDCLTETEIEQFKKMVRKIEDGENINLYQSRTLRSNSATADKMEKRTDGMYAMWGIYHLHLEIERSNKLIFCIFQPKECIVIDICPHPKGVNWSNDWLLIKLKNDLPDYYNRFKHTGDIEYIDTETRHKLRSGKNGVANVLGTSYGDVVLPMGGGMTVTGRSINSLKTEIEVKKILKRNDYLDVEKYDRIIDILIPLDLLGEIPLDLVEILIPNVWYIDGSHFASEMPEL